MEKFEQIEKKRKTIFIDNLIGGIGWALGATFGLGLIIAVFGVILKNINLVPYVGNFVAGIIEFIITKNPNLLAK
jgi:biopolymer transport protein ExbB/TolQ